MTWGVCQIVTYWLRDWMLKIHTWTFTWNLDITHLQRKIIFHPPPSLCSMLSVQGVNRFQILPYSNVNLTNFAAERVGSSKWVFEKKLPNDVAVICGEYRACFINLGKDQPNPLYLEFTNHLTSLQYASNSMAASIREKGSIRILMAQNQ